MSTPGIRRLLDAMQGKPRDLRDVVHYTGPRGWTERLPQIIGHDLLDADGNVTPAAAECADCMANLEAAARGEAAFGGMVAASPPLQRGRDRQPADDLPF